MATIAEQSIAQYIAPDPHRAGEQYAILRDEGIPVWALVAHLIGAAWNVRQAADDYELSLDAVEAAIVYYNLYRAAIDAVIAPTLAFPAH